MAQDYFCFFTQRYSHGFVANVSTLLILTGRKKPNQDDLLASHFNIVEQKGSAFGPQCKATLSMYVGGMLLL